MHKKSEPSVKSKNKQCKQKSRIQALQGASFLIKKHCKSKHCKSMYRKFSGKTTNIERKNNVCSTHPPESCEVPRCRNDELKSYARKSLNHTQACKKNNLLLYMGFNVNVIFAWSWRPLRAHAGKRIAMDMILRQIQAKATQDRAMTYQATQMHAPLSSESQLWKYTTAVITTICTKNRFPIGRPGLPV